MPLRQLTVSEVTIAARWAQQRALKRHKVRNRNLAKRGKRTRTGTGRSAAELLTAGASKMFKLAMVDPNFQGVHQNLALHVSVSKRPKPEARAYTAQQLEELWQALFTSGSSDVELDMLIVWFLVETGSRRGGPIGLTLADLDIDNLRIRMGEKNDKIDWQPASKELIVSLLEHSLRRGCGIVIRTVAGLALEDVTVSDIVAGRAVIDTGRAVFYYTPIRRKTVEADGSVSVELVAHPLALKRFQTLFKNLKRQLPWLDLINGRPHDLRKTGATFIERAFGYAVAQGWLRHSIPEAAGTYVAASDDEIRAAFEWWTGTDESDEVA